MLDPSCDLVRDDTLEKALADWTSSFYPVKDPLLSFDSDQWSLENNAIKNLPLWKQELAELCEKQEQLRDQIGVAYNYIATRQAKRDRDIEAAALDGFKAGGNNPQAGRNDLISNSSGTTQVHSGYPRQVTTPSHSSLEESLAESNFDMATTDASLGLDAPKESMQFKIPLMSVAAGSFSRKTYLQPSPHSDEGTRRRKRRRLSKKHLPVIHQNTPSTISTHDQTAPHKLPDSAAASKQECKQLPKGHWRNRPSRVLLGQPSALQGRSRVTDPSGAASLVPFESVRSPRSQRPMSYPQSQRWRKSLGVSVKALREGFERLKII